MIVAACGAKSRKEEESMLESIKDLEWCLTSRQDNHPKHASRTVVEWFKWKHTGMVEWPRCWGNLFLCKGCWVNSLPGGRSCDNCKTSARKNNPQEKLRDLWMLPFLSSLQHKGKHKLYSADRLEIIAEDCSTSNPSGCCGEWGHNSIEFGEHTPKTKLLVESQAIVMVKELENIEVMEPEPGCFQCEVSVLINKPPFWTLKIATLQSGPPVGLEEHGTAQELILKDASMDMSGTVKFTLGKAKRSSTFTRVTGHPGNLGKDPVCGLQQCL